MENNNRSALFKKLVEARKQIGGIAKDSKGHQYQYRGYAALYAKARPILDDLGIWVETDVSNFECIQLDKGSAVSGLFTLRLIDSDTGEMSEATVPMYGSDSSDKASGKACSYAMKYAFFTSFMIPTEEDMDATSPKVVRRQSHPEGMMKRLRDCRTPAELEAWKYDANGMTPDEKSKFSEEFQLAVVRCK